jgi:dihydroorotate dehydrogenase
VQRAGLRSHKASETGGLSGFPLQRRAVEMVRMISQRTGGRLPIIGVGGINSSSSAKEFLDAGAVLVQVYTGLVYQGPSLVRQIGLGLEAKGSGR